MTVEKSRASEGTAQGTRGLVELLKQRIGAMKAAIASAIKSLLGITSPSRCFSERGGAR